MLAGSLVSLELGQMIATKHLESLYCLTRLEGLFVSVTEDPQADHWTLLASPDSHI